MWGFSVPFGDKGTNLGFIFTERIQMELKLIYVTQLRLKT